MDPDTSTPPTQNPAAHGDNSAANLIRHKLDDLFTHEPASKTELAEVEATAPKRRSKHQAYMYELSTSGKSLAEIQTAWHNYYVGLPNAEKHQVWQEFYDANNPAKTSIHGHTTPPEHPSHHRASHKSYHRDPRTVTDLKRQLLTKVQQRQKVSLKHNLQSLAFGLGMGAVVLLVLLFSFFNERFIAPFITPSRNVSSSRIIIDPNSTSAGSIPEIIIPKINLEIPVVYGNTIDENAIQAELEEGAVHYASTPSPGEKGNVAIVGHSSSNIFNNGKFKFAFVLLNRLQKGDTFMLTKNGKRYVYQVYERKIVNPDDVGVLGPTDKPATATLITCDPPGSSIRRLVVIGEQINPSPSLNKTSTAIRANHAPTIVPGNSISLWQRLKDWISG